jgi:hypothetical protein
MMRRSFVHGLFVAPGALSEVYVFVVEIASD